MQRYDLILVGGVPGSGKSTAIAVAVRGFDHVQALDPEQVTTWLRVRVPTWVPYGGYRWLVHLAHAVRVVARLIAGPRRGRVLVVHDPGTRVRRRGLYLRLARLAAWSTASIYLDVDRSAARAGQRLRGRVVRSFDGHWESWRRLRPILLAREDFGPTAEDSELVLIVNRHDAAMVLRHLCRPADA